MALRVAAHHAYLTSRDNLVFLATSGTDYESYFLALKQALGSIWPSVKSLVKLTGASSLFQVLLISRQRNSVSDYFKTNTLSS